MSCVLGFTFYGVGNIGDDLVLDGFVHEFKRSEVIEGFSSNPKSQLRRFPRIAWYSNSDPRKHEVLAKASAWIGIGDTPFQLTSGHWFVNELRVSLSAARWAGIATAMLSVGAEREAMSERELFRPLLRLVDVVWTRDEASSDILLALGIKPGRINTGADLAHLTLSRVHCEVDERPYDLGLGYYSESSAHDDIAALASFVRRLLKESRLVCYISNEFRQGYETLFYTKLLSFLHKQPGKLRWLRRQAYVCAETREGTVPIFVPEYHAGSVADFVVPYARCKVVLSSRYHGILAAAWAGCRVGILGGRSSKLDALALQFGIPIIRPPYSQGALAELADNALSVPRARLATEAAKAEESVRGLEAWLAAI
jgi:hypothetical protein